MPADTETAADLAFWIEATRRELSTTTHARRKANLKRRLAELESELAAVEAPEMTQRDREGFWQQEATEAAERREHCRRHGHEDVADLELAGSGGRSIRGCTYCGETFGKAFD